MTATELLHTLRTLRAAGDVQASTWLRGGKEAALAALALAEIEQAEAVDQSRESDPAPENGTAYVTS